MAAATKRTMEVAHGSPWPHVWAAHSLLVLPSLLREGCPPHSRNGDDRDGPADLAEGCTPLPFAARCFCRCRRCHRNPVARDAAQHQVRRLCSAAGRLKRSAARSLQASCASRHVPPLRKPFHEAAPSFRLCRHTRQPLFRPPHQAAFRLKCALNQVPFGGRPFSPGDTPSDPGGCLTPAALTCPRGMPSLFWGTSLLASAGPRRRRSAPRPTTAV